MNCKSVFWVYLLLTYRDEVKKQVNAVEVQLKEAGHMRAALGAMTYAAPVVAVYDPLAYAWEAFRAYVERYGEKTGRVLFLGMNPGPWGMAQTGVPFGEVGIVRDWLQITAEIGRPAHEHPKYPVDGYACPRSEVSGRRLWGLFRDRFATPERFFAGHFVMNYCPLLFIAAKTLKSGKESASNLTPDKLPQAEREKIYAVCGENLRAAVVALRPSVVVGIGAFAETRAREAADGLGVPVVRILHPSPASPRSNADWAGEATRQMRALGIWD